LRAAKDEAKKIVLQNFPHLFRNSDMNLHNNESSGGKNDPFNAIV